MRISCPRYTGSRWHRPYLYITIAGIFLLASTMSFVATFGISQNDFNNLPFELRDYHGSYYGYLVYEFGGSGLWVLIFATVLSGYSSTWLLSGRRVTGIGLIVSMAAIAFVTLGQFMWIWTPANIAFLYGLFAFAYLCPSCGPFNFLFYAFIMCPLLAIGWLSMREK